MNCPKSKSPENKIISGAFKNNKLLKNKLGKSINNFHTCVYHSNAKVIKKLAKSTKILC